MNIKLNKLAQNRLNEKEMNNITGGYIWFTLKDGKGNVVSNCGCGCYYANNGGSSTSDNMNANIAGNLHSPQ